MLLHSEGGAAQGWWLDYSCLWWLHLKAVKEEVKLLCQLWVTVDSGEVWFVFGDALNATPPASCCYC